MTTATTRTAATMLNQGVYARQTEGERERTVFRRVTGRAILGVFRRELTDAEASIELERLEANADHMELPLSIRQRWSEAAARLRPHLNGGASPTAANHKPVSEVLQVFKTLARMARFHGGGDVGLTEGIRRAEELMPFFRAHFKRLRGERCTTRHLQDMAVTVRPTLARYQSGKGLSADRQALRRLAIDVLDRDVVLTEGDLMVLLVTRTAKDRRSLGMVDQPCPVCLSRATP
jgi:hypothetical protein